MSDSALNEFFNITNAVPKNENATPNKEIGHKSDNSNNNGSDKSKYLNKLNRYIAYTEMVIENLKIMEETEAEAVEKLKKVNGETDKFYKYGILGEKIPNDVDVYSISSIKRLYDALEDKKNQNFNDFLMEQKKLERNIAFLEEDLIPFKIYGKEKEAGILLVKLKNLNNDYKNEIERMYVLEPEYQKAKERVNDALKKSEVIKQEILDNANKKLQGKER